MAGPAAARALVDQTGIAWRLARQRVAGLTDDELLWEPVAGCWSLRPADPGDPAGPWGLDGNGVAAPEPPPFTTIGWLIGHMTLGTWNWNALIAGVPVPPEPALAGRAAEAVALWSEVVDDFEHLVTGFSDDDLCVRVEAWGGRVARAFLVSHVVAEVLHHAAEVGRMRDLYRNRATLTVGLLPAPSPRKSAASFRRALGVAGCSGVSRCRNRA